MSRTLPIAVAATLALLALGGCATCRERADAWIGQPIAEAVEEFGPPDERNPVGPNERYTWVRAQRVSDAWASTGRTPNPLKGGALPRGEAPSARPIEPADGRGISSRTGSLLVSPKGVVLAWSGSCEAFGEAPDLFTW